MIRKTVAIALALSLAALAATLSARPGGAAHRRYTMVNVAYFPSTGIGGRAAAKRLGMRYIVTSDNLGGERGAIRYYKSLIARHVDAIATGGYTPAFKPIFRKVRKAGILLISSGDDIAGGRDLWVNYSDTAAFPRAIADALASQIHGKGEFAILDEQGEFPIAHTWVKEASAYIAKAYPNMKSDGLQTETGAGDQTEADSIKSFMSAHPNLKGLIGITPTETYMAAEAITQAGRIGQVFSASNGGDYLGPELAGYIRSGAMEDVMGGDPAKLGYLTVWAAHRLLTGRHFRPGAYRVGGPIGTVHYYKRNKELRLGQPLTITKANVDVRRTVGDPR